MKKLIFLPFIALVCILMFSSCDKKQRAMDNLSDFVEKVEKNAPEYTEEDWTNVNKEYDELIAEINKYEYTSDESKRIASLKGKFAGIKAKYDVDKFIDGIGETIEEVKGFFGGFFGGSDKSTE